MPWDRKWICNKNIYFFKKSKIVWFKPLKTSERKKMQKWNLNVHFITKAPLSFHIHEPCIWFKTVLQCHLKIPGVPDLSIQAVQEVKTIFTIILNIIWHFILIFILSVQWSLLKIWYAIVSQLRVIALMANRIYDCVYLYFKCFRFNF